MSAVAEYSGLSDVLDRIIVVLVEPQDDINIGNTVRACKNFGIRHIRLVRPAKAHVEHISISAPRARDVIDAMVHYDSLDEAIADCALVVATSARTRHVKRTYLEPRGAALELVSVAATGARVAVLFGREDSGLPNEALDRCSLIVCVPTDPEYSSLNLGQAVLLIAWEVFRQAQNIGVEVSDAHVVHPKSEHPPATQKEFERLFAHTQRTLTEVGFIKDSSRAHTERTLRELFLRMRLDTREISIWHGIFSQVDWATAQGDSGTD